ncbi:beta strand repeat-containing protein, partial [Microcystis wesenbergii]
SFGPATNFTLGSRLDSVTVGDFNGDGKSDLAVANVDGGNVSVLLGTGTGSFGTATNFTVGVGLRSVTVGDFNGDGKSDLAVANTFGYNVSVLLGTGTGSFGTATNFTVGSGPRSVTVGDFNGDGKSDLAVANRLGNNVSILLNADPTATVTITDVSQPAISLTINDVTVTEGNSGTTNAVFTVSLSSAASTVVSVNYATANGTATAGTDYTALPTTTLTFNPGETSKTITVAVNGDNQVELNETFFLNLSNLQTNGSNVTLADNQGQGTINNDDSASIAISDVTITEGNSGTTNAVFTVTLSNAVDTAVTVNYATADGTATTADNDYTAIATTPLIFNAGETSKTITVAVNGDNQVESNETFFVNLSNLQTNGRNVTITDNQGQGTITDDDTLQSITILDFESPLPQGLSSVSFWQGTSVPSTAKITNQYAPSGVLMSGVALINHGLGHAASGVNGIGGIGLESSVDYDAPLTFQFVSSVNSSTPAYTNYFAISPDLWGGSGNNVKITAYGFDNTILGVTTYTETGNLSPSTPIEIQNVGKIYKVVVDASLAFVGGGGIGFDLVKFEVPTVDAPSITLAVAPASVTEDGTTNLVYTFTRSGVTSNALTVNYTLGGTATLNTDYTRTGTNNTVTFAAGSSTATVTVDPTPDTIVEPDETVILTLASGTGYTIGTTTPVTGTITNGPVTPSITLAVSPASVTEDGTSNLVYTFTRSGVTSNALTVNYTLGGTATLNTDYTRSGTNNTVTFAANSSTATVIVDPTADTTVESNETVALTLASGTGYTIGTPNAATGTITNDDTSVTLAVSPASVTENGTTNLIYTFTRTGVTTSALTANYTVGGTATFNTDYTQTGAASFTSTTGTVTFAANATTATVTVDPTADTTVESDETVVLTLATGTGYTIGTPTAVTGTINNDDTNVTLAVSPGSVTEDGTNNLVYTFTRTGVTTNALTVNYTLGGTATLNTDYTRTGTNNTVTFAANSATATVTVDPTADTTVESDETV